MTRKSALRATARSREEWIDADCAEQIERFEARERLELAALPAEDAELAVTLR